MRKLKRRIARVKMAKEGIQHMNRKVPVYEDGVIVANKSYFSQHWREYC